MDAYQYNNLLIFIIYDTMYLARKLAKIKKDISNMWDVRYIPKNSGAH